jgi:hypothetical protein
MFAGWVFTLIIGAAISAGLFAWGAYAPNLGSSTQNAMVASLAGSSGTVSAPRSRRAPGALPPGEDA